MNAYRRSRGVAPLIQKLGSRWRCVVNVTLEALYVLTRTAGTMNRRLRGPYSRLDVSEKTEISFPCWDWNPKHSICIPSTIATMSTSYEIHLFYGYDRIIVRKWILNGSVKETATVYSNKQRYSVFTWWCFNVCTCHSYGYQGQNTNLVSSKYETGLLHTRPLLSFTIRTIMGFM
jgi:hypothetical protein